MLYVLSVFFFRSKNDEVGGRIEEGNKKQLNKLFVGILGCCFVDEE
jgi:hypothetical protein